MAWSRNTRCVLFCLVGLLLPSLPAHAQPAVTVTELGTLGGDYGWAYGVNNHGQVVGMSSTASNARFHATLWWNGTVIDLGSLCSTCSYSYSVAYDVNDAGQVVGQSWSALGYRAFVWENGTMRALPPLPGDFTSSAFGINARGQVVGLSAGFTGLQGVIWTDGVPRDVGSLGGRSGGGLYTVAYDVNDAGQVVGISAAAPTDRQHAFLWEDGAITDLGAGTAAPGCPDDSSFAYGISGAGEIVGHIVHACSTRALKWINGPVQTLLPAPSDRVSAFGRGINEAGHVAGASSGFAACPSAQHAALWKDGALIDLGALSGACGFSWGEDLNDKGQVAGYATRNGFPVAVLFSVETEQPDTVAPIVSVPADLTVEASSAAGAVVEFVVSADDDVDGTVVATCSHHSGATFPLGVTTVTCEATDVAGNTGSATFRVTVVDTTAPAIASVIPSRPVLGPPNHKMEPVAFAVDASDAASAFSCSVTSVASNEPVSGTGDGDTAPDWEITGPLSVNLRAERAGNGTGRIYTVTVECRDAFNNVATVATTISVPHDRRR